MTTKVVLPSFCLLSSYTLLMYTRYTTPSDWQPHDRFVFWNILPEYSPGEFLRQSRREMSISEMRNEEKTEKRIERN